MQAATDADQADGPSGPSWIQIYGAGITSSPFASEVQSVREARAVFTTFADGVSALALLRSWQRLADEGHPLLQTYGDLVDVRPDHPRARFLLLLQALEGLYGHENQEQIAARQAEHTERRKAVLATAAERMATDYRFVKNNLRKDPAASLNQALEACLTTLPTDLTGSLDSARLTQRLLAEQPGKADNTLSAIRIVRNDLAHGNRGYGANELDEVAGILERVARAHMLRLLECPVPVLTRALQ